MAATKSPFRTYIILTQFFATLMAANLIFQRLRGITEELPASPEVFEGPFWQALFSPVYWLGQVPMIFYIAALWPAVAVFKALNRGEPFSAAAVKGLNGIGTCLTLGAACALTFVPFGVSLLSGEAILPRGEALSLAPILLLIGVVMIAIGQAGAKLQAEVDSYI